MADQEIRDRSGLLLGRIKQLSSGKLEGRDASGGAWLGKRAFALSRGNLRELGRIAPKGDFL